MTARVVRQWSGGYLKRDGGELVVEDMFRRPDREKQEEERGLDALPKDLQDVIRETVEVEKEVRVLSNSTAFLGRFGLATSTS